ncbi:hypothetical protein R50072_29070 [Simiduia litorea]
MRLGHLDTGSTQVTRQDLIPDRLAIDQHAIAIKNKKPRLFGRVQRLRELVHN